MKDTEEIPAVVRKELKFVPLEYAKEVLDEALDPASKAKPKKATKTKSTKSKKETKK